MPSLRLSHWSLRPCLTEDLSGEWAPWANLVESVQLLNFFRLFEFTSVISRSSSRYIKNITWFHMISHFFWGLNGFPVGSSRGLECSWHSPGGHSRSRLLLPAKSFFRTFTSFKTLLEQRHQPWWDKWDQWDMVSKWLATIASIAFQHESNHLTVGSLGYGMKDSMIMYDYLPDLPTFAQVGWVWRHWTDFDFRPCAAEWVTWVWRIS